MSKAKAPIFEPDFWKKRLADAKEYGEIHRSVYIVDISQWQAIQDAHAALLPRLLEGCDSVLDAGCGYGALNDLIPHRLRYIGVDLSPDLIQEARLRSPASQFLCEDIRKMACKDGQFDACVARSMEGTIKDHVGEETWQQILAELRRVARRVILLSYEEPKSYTVLEK